MAHLNSLAQPSAAALLAWYDRHRRDLPWREHSGACADPYRIWLSEIMLQQTTVAAAKPYFRAFTQRWPTVADLAAAPLDDILAAWAGLGYYARARNLHACARTVAADHGGRFPDTEEDLRALPGIGPYTAAAIAAIAFGRPAAAVDGNVERVIARLFAIDDPLPKAKAAIRDATAAMVPSERPGDFAQAMMDLGATICTPKRPACTLCPWLGSCQGEAAGVAERLPVKPAKAERPVRRAIAFWAQHEDGRILLARRPEHGLLGGMAALWATPLTADTAPNVALDFAPIEAEWRRLPGEIEHVFTHFRLRLFVFATRGTTAAAPLGSRWATEQELEKAGLPTVMRKAVAHVRERQEGRPVRRRRRIRNG
jgi:A/G-specific adenine glycosylase